MSAGPCPQARIKPGDYLLCVTDGVTEAPDRQGKLYGEQRVHGLFRKLASEGLDPTAIVEAIRADLVQYTDGGAARDDVTIVVVRF